MAAVGAVSATVYAGTAARALAAGHPSYAGLSEAGVACGSVIGGLGWGRLHPVWTWRRSLTLLLALLGAALLVASLAGGYGPFTVALVFAGLAMSPTYVVAYRASDLLVDRAEVVEAGTWVNTATNLGVSLGGAASGFLVGHRGAHAPTWAGAAVALACAVMLLHRRRGRRAGVTGGRAPRRASGRSG
jgi:predicted MFS family arabinose efflux permease